MNLHLSLLLICRSSYAFTGQWRQRGVATLSKRRALPQRLEDVAQLVRPGEVVADIGCDHGQLACSLAASGRSPTVIAIDVNADPLANAVLAIERAGLGGRVEARLGDGIGALTRGDNVTTLCLAGMGEKSMRGALRGGAALRALGVRALVLQPPPRADAAQLVSGCEAAWPETCLPLM